MKKIILICLLLLTTTSVFALRAWNPFLRDWAITIEDNTYHVRFFEGEKVKNLETGEEYWYDWGYDDILTIFDLNGEDVDILILEFNNTEDEFVGETPDGIIVYGIVK